MRAVLACVLGMAVLAGSCAAANQTTPTQRAVVVSTTACGFASKTTGSGVVVGPGKVLTAAHVVVGASAVEVQFADGKTSAATVVLLDTGRDLAVLVAPNVEASEVEFVQLEVGESATLIEGASSGSVAVQVLRRASLNVDEVRGTERSSRAGYELAAVIDGGDSGAGVFDQQGRLAAIVFATSTERDGIAWAIRAEELESVLAAPPTTGYSCDPTKSRIVPPQS